MEVFTGLRPPEEARVLKAPPEEACASSRLACGGRSEDRGGATGKRRPAGPRGGGGAGTGPGRGGASRGKGGLSCGLGKAEAWGGLRKTEHWVLGE